MSRTGRRGPRGGSCCSLVAWAATKALVAEVFARAWLGESPRQGVVAEQAVRGVSPCGAGDEPRCINDNGVTAGADGVDCDGFQKLYDCYKDCCDLDGTEETLKSCAGRAGKGEGRDRRGSRRDARRSAGVGGCRAGGRTADREGRRSVALAWTGRRLAVVEFAAGLDAEALA